MPAAAGTRDPLVVRLPRPLDHALLERTLQLHDSAGQRLVGEVSITYHERCWFFRPEQPWTAGAHELVIDTTLEDQAGNRIGRAFEVDELPPIDKTVVPEFYRLPLTIPAAR
jgi:hypothetical protein